MSLFFLFVGKDTNLMLTNGSFQQKNEYFRRQKT